MSQTNQNYPLSNKYTLWFHQVNHEDWTSEAYIKVCTIESIQDFWEMSNTLPHITSGMFYVMKEDIFPKWEDVNNLDGGFWSFRVPKKESNVVWYNVIMALISGTLVKNEEANNEICGVSISPKIHNCIIKIWNNNATHHNPDIITNSINHINPRDSIYKKHQEQANFGKD